MSDSWLRPVFARKTPNLSALPQPERQPTPSIDEGMEADETAISKTRPTSRVSSLMGFRPNSPTVATSDVFQSIIDPESTYHKPSSDQVSFAFWVFALEISGCLTNISTVGRMLIFWFLADGGDSSSRNDESKSYGPIAHRIQCLYFARPRGLL